MCSKLSFYFNKNDQIFKSNEIVVQALKDVDAVNEAGIYIYSH